MADLSDLTAYLAQQAASAVYPSGTSSASVANMDCRIFEGWPIPNQLDLDMAGKMQNADGEVVSRPGGPVANVSIFPMQGTGVNVYQNLDKTYVIQAPSYGMTFSLDGDTITVTGQPKTGEYLTLIIDDGVVCSQGGATTAALLAALATEAQGSGYSGASSTADTLTVPAGHSLVVRQGGTGKLGKATHRQRHSVMVTVWAPNQATRATLAKAIDNLIKQTIRASMPDTSQATILYNRTNVIDEQQSQTIYRRDLIYDVEYATVEQFVGYVITSTQTSIAKPQNVAIATATT
ncbi:hypothetical protein [Bradyrhizobium erythrophlei]|uniref:Uncharacterized protein n=1 Tax=Bradyrhizobium erythrophlei TaxID=1437360 RepID=A0A1M5NRR7_9BRAD|nr:hypothetical protein [Bradyrhizobium erythrophlei]SHG91623.1 hypothetical protein SAMN05443248_3076 [Bradyrhizobium erythrophlei]